MLQMVRIQTMDGVREFPFVPHAAALQAAAYANEIMVGQEFIYREYIVMMLAENELLVLDRIQMPVPPMGGWSQSPDGMQWSFTMGGQAE